MTKPLQVYNFKIDERYKSLKAVAGKEFKKIQEFIDKNKNGENARQTDITTHTERKYIDAFSMCYKNISKKQIGSLTKTDLTKLKADLKNGKILSRYNKPYSVTSIRDMELILIRFLEFLNPSKYAGFRSWFVAKVPKKSVEYLKEDEIEKLYNACNTDEERYMIAVLFDSGFRASEFLNIRFEDIEEPTQSFPYYKILCKHEYSKTIERNIGMYWKKSTEAIRNYLAGLDNSKPKEPVFKRSYDAVRMFISRLGMRVLKKRVHLHIFRKSSASYYAKKIKNRQQMCYRYGWNFSSDVPDVYINRELGEEEVKDTISNTTIEKVNQENTELKSQLNLVMERLERIEKEKALLKYIQPSEEENKVLRKMRGYPVAK